MQAHPQLGKPVVLLDSKILLLSDIQQMYMVYLMPSLQNLCITHVQSVEKFVCG